jgi:hypothetical protein
LPSAADAFTPLTSKNLKLADPMEFAIFEIYPHLNLGTVPSRMCFSAARTLTQVLFSGVQAVRCRPATSWRTC